MARTHFTSALGAAALIAGASLSLSAQAAIVDFEGLGHGEVLNIEQASGFSDWDPNGTGSLPTSGPYAGGIPGSSVGLQIQANNNNSGSSDSEFAVVFDTEQVGTRDPDLEDPFDGPFNTYTFDQIGPGDPQPGQPGHHTPGHDGGVTASAAVAAELQNPGNIAIVQEDHSSGTDNLLRFPGCYEGLCEFPDDEFASGSNTFGYILFEFDTLVTLTSIDVFDIEAGSEQAGQIDFWDGTGDLIAELLFPVTGDNGAARLFFNGGAGYSNIAQAKVTFVGSGGIDNLAIAVPEPSTLVLMALGIAGIGFYRRRQLN